MKKKLLPVLICLMLIVGTLFTAANAAGSTAEMTVNTRIYDTYSNKVCVSWVPVANASYYKVRIAQRDRSGSYTDVPGLEFRAEGNNAVYIGSYTFELYGIGTSDNFKAKVTAYTTSGQSIATGTSSAFATGLSVQAAPASVSLTKYGVASWSTVSGDMRYRGRLYGKELGAFGDGSFVQQYEGDGTSFDFSKYMTDGMVYRMEIYCTTASRNDSKLRSASTYSPWVQYVKAYTVTFNANGHGTAPSPQKVAAGKNASVPVTPTATGWKFGGWYTDSACTKPYSFSTAVTKDITLYGKWVLDTKPGWNRIDGKDYYCDENSKPITGWKKIDGYRYYFSPVTNPAGQKSCGFWLINNAFYYFGSDGKMRTGWQTIGDVTYYFDGEGIAASGWLPYGDNWYFFNEEWEMVTGWKTIGGYRYYFDEDGVMVEDNWQFYQGDRYYLDENGHMVTGWKSDYGDWYYFDSTGALVTYDWVLSKGKWYYFDGGGYMQTGWKTIDGKIYCLDPVNGDMFAKTGCS